MDIKDSFNNALNGILETIKTEIHMKIHVFATIVVIFLSLIVNISRIELLILLITISMIWAAEIINTAIENTVDLITEEENKLAKKAKDAAAGAVMILALVSVFIGYIIFFDKLLKIFANPALITKLSGRISHMSVLTLSLIFVLVIVIKAYLKKGTALEGGMPSGHAAISSSLLVILMHMTKDLRIIFIGLLLCLIVCQSRVKAKIHSIKEVVAGFLLGFSVSYAIFHLLIKYIK